MVARAPLSVCEARLRERERLLDPEAIARLWADFEDLGDLEGNVLEVAGISPEEAADAIARLLAEGQLAL